MLYLKPMVVVFVSIGLVQLIINILISYFTGTSSQLSVVYIMTVFLAAMAISVPLHFFRQIMELGAGFLPEKERYLTKINKKAVAKVIGNSFF